jgi:hypothetical protein
MTKRYVIIMKQNTAEDITPSQCELPHVQAVNIVVVYLHILERQRRAVRQLLYVVDNARAGDFQPRFEK